MYNGFDATVEVFNDLKSAKIYFEMMKSNIIKEYLDYARCETIEELVNDEYFYMNETSVLDYDQYLYVKYDDYIHDKLFVYKKPIIKFNTEDI
jgi:hypothetical protein